MACSAVCHVMPSVLKCYVDIESEVYGFKRTMSNLLAIRYAPCLCVPLVIEGLVFIQPHFCCSADIPAHTKMSVTTSGHSQFNIL